MVWRATRSASSGRGRGVNSKRAQNLEASITEESSVQRTADGKQDAARRRRPSEACAQRRRATLAGGELWPDLRPVPALCGTSLLRSARARGPDGGCTADSGGDDDASAPVASWPPLVAGPAAGGGQRRAPTLPGRDAGFLKGRGKGRAQARDKGAIRAPWPPFPFLLERRKGRRGVEERKKCQI